eukprot:TRINITY_DN6525_c0_g1_i9.p1 TRINITY_DN6525_c0_g1~~TRINITY_DN6525_c0_g1_i9.p1  ORF type:complete len:339 (-),score=61.96 TRINITY_DN6525_c0_g1_i9:239-1255(-)
MDKTDDKVKNQNNAETFLRKWSSDLILQQSTQQNNHDNQIDKITKKPTKRIRPSSTLDALSLEKHTIWQDGRITETYTVTSFHVSDNSEELVNDLLDEILEFVVDTAERKRREQIVEGYLTKALPAPLVSRDEVQQLGQSLSTASVSLQSSTIRLRAAWKLILVSTAQQLCISFRRILEKYDFELRCQLEEQGLEQRSILTDSTSGILIRLIKDRCRIYVEHQNKRRSTRDQTLKAISQGPSKTDNDTDDNKDEKIKKETEEEFEKALVQYFQHEENQDTDRSESDAIMEALSDEAYRELQEVTDRILSLAVEYLKNATRSVVDDATQDIKEIVYSHL